MELLYGASEFLNRRANEEMQRLFEEHLRNRPPAPLHEIVDNPRRAGSAGGFPVPGRAGGTAQIFRIGTPSEKDFEVR